MVFTAPPPVGGPARGVLHSPKSARRGVPIPSATGPCELRVDAIRPVRSRASLCGAPESGGPSDCPPDQPMWLTAGPPWARFAEGLLGAPDVPICALRTRTARDV